MSAPKTPCIDLLPAGGTPWSKLLSCCRPSARVKAAHSNTSHLLGLIIKVPVPEPPTLSDTANNMVATQAPFIEAPAELADSSMTLPGLNIMTGPNGNEHDVLTSTSPTWSEPFALEGRDFGLESPMSQRFMIRKNVAIWEDDATWEEFRSNIDWGAFMPPGQQPFHANTLTEAKQNGNVEAHGPDRTYPLQEVYDCNRDLKARHEKTLVRIQELKDINENLVKAAKRANELANEVVDDNKNSRFPDENLQACLMTSRDLEVGTILLAHGAAHEEVENLAKAGLLARECKFEPETPEMMSS